MAVAVEEKEDAGGPGLVAGLEGEVVPATVRDEELGEWMIFGHPSAGTVGAECRGE